jgi:hypothetical protein
MVYDAEYDKMRQLGGSRRERLHAMIAMRSTSQGCPRLQPAI